MQYDLMTTDEAAAFLRCSVSFLNQARLTGNGPPFVKMGRRVVYTRTDLEAFIAKRTVQNTAQAARA